MRRRSEEKETYTYHDFALIQHFLSTVLYRGARHESSSSPSTRDETKAEEKGNFPAIKRVLQGKQSSH